MLDTLQYRWSLGWEGMICCREPAVKDGTIWETSGPTHKIQRGRANSNSVWILVHLWRILSGLLGRCGKRRGDLHSPADGGEGIQLGRAPASWREGWTWVRRLVRAGEGLCGLAQAGGWACHQWKRASWLAVLSCILKHHLFHMLIGFAAHWNLKNTFLEGKNRLHFLYILLSI